MNQYLLLMYEDAPVKGGMSDDGAWTQYFQSLHASGQFDGGSAIGTGACFSSAGSARTITQHLTGFIRVRAASLEDARCFLQGNPVYEAGGTVEIRELPRDN